MTQQRSRLICLYCGEPILRSKDSYDERWEGSAIERAWHRHCEPLAVPPDSPFQSAVQKAKQAIEDARRLDDESFESFAIIVALALSRQRP